MDEVVSSFAFKFNLRCYIVARRAGLTVHFLNAPGHFVCMVGRVEGSGFQGLGFRV
jgi:hypothetical protein